MLQMHLAIEVTRLPIEGGGGVLMLCKQALLRLHTPDLWELELTITPFTTYICFSCERILHHTHFHINLRPSCLVSQTMNLYRACKWL